MTVRPQDSRVEAITRTGEGVRYEGECLLHGWTSVRSTDQQRDHKDSLVKDIRDASIA